MINPLDKKPNIYKNNRNIDDLGKNIHSWWGKTFVFIQRKRIKTWQGVFAIAFIAGSLTALIWAVSVNIQTKSVATGESATLKIATSTNSVVSGDNFTATVNLNTNGSGAVAVRAIVKFDPQYFSLQSWDDSSGVFAASNTCQYNGKACEKIEDDRANGQIAITVAKPAPGVIASSGTVASLVFKSLQPVSPTAPNITLASSGYASTNSAVIWNDGKGTNILNNLTGATVTVNAPACASFVYSAWGSCQPDSTQTRTITSGSPAGCAGGSPVLTQACTYVAPTCASFTYSTWGTCQSNSTQSRTVVSSSPANCTGGSPVLTQSCTYVNPSAPTCTSFTYSTWGKCTAGKQSRKVLSSSPTGCTGGSPILTQICKNGKQR